MAISAGSVYSELILDGSKYFSTLEKAEKQAENFQKKLEKTGKNMEKVGKNLSKYVTAPIVAVGTLSTKAAIDFESAFAGVRKTVDASEEDFAKLEKGIKDMSKEIPASATAISEVAEAAGQLGIKTENILGFTRVMIDLGESTNMSADEAATALARLANITGMSQTDFDRLGSTIVDLGNNLATTEAEIVNMAMRLAGAGSQIGLTEAEIMSFAGALSSVGIEAEAGGSAFSKVMVDMQLAVETNSERLKQFADVAGMSADEFRKAFQEDAAGAIIAFIQGLGTAEDRGLSAIKVLDDMGISEVRLRDALLRASGASDVFTQSLKIGTNAWEENTALTKEAEQRYQTTASQLQIAKNHLQDAAITIGEIMVPHLVNLAEKIKKLAEWFKNLNPETQEAIVKMAGLAAAIGPLLIITRKLSQGIGSTIEVGKKLIDNWDNIKRVGGILSNVLKLTVGLIFSPTGAIIAGIAATIAIGVALYKNWDIIKEKAGELKNKIGEAWDNIKTKTSETWENIKSKTNDTWGNMKSNTASAWQAMRGKIDEHGGGIKGIIGTYTEIYKTVWGSALKTMDDLTGGKFSAMVEKVKGAFNKVKESIQSGISKIKEWNQQRVENKEATFTQRVKQVFETVGEKIKGIGRNAEGTNYWRGGLTWVGEQGPELIELPRGSKVYSNQKSMEMASSMGRSIVQNIHIHSPEPLSPSEIARKNLQVSRQLAMEWGV